MNIQAYNICKKFQHLAVLDDVSLNINSGELIALLGPSGSGKTTLLRIIAGLEQADSGQILLKGEDLQNKPIQERQLGFVFQHYALFKHMSVFDNIAFGLKMRPKKHRLSDADIHKKVRYLLELVHLEAFCHHYPNELSGGQRQRVALARALAIEPKVLLLDEPFGALDTKVRQELRRWMRKLHDDIHLTSILVTHDQEEAIEISDRIVIMSHGKIEQVGTPENIWKNPANKFVYDFLGHYNEFNGWKDKITGKIHLSHPANDVNTNIKILVRPYEMGMSKLIPQQTDYIRARILHIHLVGLYVKLELQCETGRILQVDLLETVFQSLKLKKEEKVYVYPLKSTIFE